MDFSPPVFRTGLLAALDGHARYFARPPGDHAVLRRQIAAGDALHDRRTWPGHVTTSAIVLDLSGRKTLLIRHRALDRWMQPGGHYEAPDDLAASALREALEETGLIGLTLDPWHRASEIPIDIDTHAIPDRPSRGEPEHWHHDVRYVVRADPDANLAPDLSEVGEAAWHPVSTLGTIAPTALRHMASLGLATP